MKKLSPADRRAYARRRRFGTVLITVTALAFFGSSIVIGGLEGSQGWIVWLCFAAFVASCALFVFLNRCPYCGKVMIRGSMTRQECPRCRKALVFAEGQKSGGRKPK